MGTNTVIADYGIELMTDTKVNHCMMVHSFSYLKR